MAGFRGTLDPLPIDFGASGRSMAIYGDNAAGKSSITDAIEWFYFDKVDHLWRENCKSDALRHVLLPAGDAATVELQFTEGGLNCVKSMSSELATSISNRGRQLTEYLAKIQNGNERLTLRTIDIVTFILQTKAERRKELERIIGYEALNSFREIVGPTLYKLERTPEYIAAQSNIQDQQREILKIARTGIIREKELFEAGQRIASEVGITGAITDAQTYDAVVAAIREKIRDKDRAIKKVALSECGQKCDTLSQRAGETNPSLGKFSEAYGELIASEEQVRQLRLKEFLLAGKKAIDDRLVPADICPLCLQSSPWEQLRNDVAARITMLEQSKQKYDAALSAKSETLSILSRAAKAGEEFLSSASKVELETHSLKTAEEYVDAVRRLERAITDGFEGFKPIATDIGHSTATVLELSKRVSELLRAQETALELSAEEEKLLEVFQRLEALNGQFRKFEKTSQTVKAFEKQIGALSSIRDRFSDLHRDALQNALDVMSGDIGRYYLAMHPKQEVDEIKLSVIEDGVEFEYKFHGKRVFLPPKYLSESHLNSLAIAAFLASANIFNKTNNFIVLDDIVTSFDANHRVRLLRLLKDEFSEWQVINLTHERFWFEMIKKELGPSGWLVSEIETVTGVGVQLKKSPGSLTEVIAEKKLNATLTANDLRTLLERSLKDIDSSLEVKVAFRYNGENELRMVGELLSELRSTLKRKSPGILSGTPFSRMEVCNLVTTMGSHDSGPVLSPGDLDTSCEDVINFDAQFFCEVCAHYVAVERLVPHDKKIFCKCGKKNLEWKD